MTHLCYILNKYTNTKSTKRKFKLNYSSRLLRAFSLNFIYFTTITKQVIQLILIMLVGTDVCVRMVFVWEETGVPGGNPPV